MQKDNTELSARIDKQLNAVKEEMKSEVLEVIVETKHELE